MKLEEEGLKVLCNHAKKAAKKAGEIITANSGKNIHVEHKEVGSSKASQVVTEVDRNCQDAILEILEPTFKQFDLGLLTEESPDDESRFIKDYFWCIDPMDGTLAFTLNEPGYSVSVALVSKEGHPVIGVVFNPVEDKLYVAIKNQGVEINGKNFQPEKEKNNTHLTFVTDRSFVKNPFYAEIKSALEELTIQMDFKALKIIEENGGAVVNACRVLENQPAFCFKLPKKEKGGGCLWDYAATTCLFEEAGLYAGNILGEKLDLNSSASTFMNVKGIFYVSDLQVKQGMIPLLNQYVKTH